MIDELLDKVKDEERNVIKSVITYVEGNEFEKFDLKVALACECTFTYIK